MFSRPFLVLKYHVSTLLFLLFPCHMRNVVIRSGKWKEVLQRQLVKCGINYLFHNFLCGCSHLDFNSWQLFIFFLILGNNDSFILLCINYFFLVYKMLQVSDLLQRSMRRVVSVCPIAVYFLVKKCEIEKLWISPCVWIFENSMKENLALLKHFSLPVQSRCYKNSNDCLFLHQSLILLCCSYIFLCYCFHRSK